VRIRSIAHKGLRRLYEDNSAKGVDAAAVDKLRKMLTFLEAMQTPDELGRLPTWHAHRLTGDRKGTWSLHVSASWRLTFRIKDDEIVDLNLENYH
jgi:proteic killer suppression protein